MDIYFIDWVIIQYYAIYFFAQFFQLWPLGVLLGWFFYPFDMPTHFGFFGGNSSLAATIQCSRFILYFPCPALELVISLRSPGAFYWNMVFRNHCLFIAFGMSLLLGPFSRQN